MKKVCTVLAGIVITATSFAQFSFGVQGIGNLSDAKIKFEDGQNVAKKMRVLPGAGLLAQYAVNEKLSIRSGVNFLQHGITVKTAIPTSGGNVPAVNATAKSRLNYLQLPVNILATFSSEKRQFFAGAGGYLNYGISGKTKVEGEYISNGATEKFAEETDAFKNDADGNPGLKKADWGIGALAGVRMSNGLFANVGYQLGLSDISNSDNGGEYKSRGLQLTIGYFFK
ncbi:hypothetical protein BH11BAC3_BH11BAC3_11710 [soil metagenome]